MPSGKPATSETGREPLQTLSSAPGRALTLADPRECQVQKGEGKNVLRLIWFIGDHESQSSGWL